MELTVSKIFSDYIFDPLERSLSATDQRLATVTKIALAILSLGIIYLIYRIGFYQRNSNKKIEARVLDEKVLTLEPIREKIKRGQQFFGICSSALYYPKGGERAPLDELLIQGEIHSYYRLRRPNLIIRVTADASEPPGAELLHQSKWRTKESVEQERQFQTDNYIYRDLPICSNDLSPSQKELLKNIVDSLNTRTKHGPWRLSFPNVSFSNPIYREVIDLLKDQGIIHSYKKDSRNYSDLIVYVTEADLPRKGR